MKRNEAIEIIMEIISSEAFTFGYDQKQAEYVLSELVDSGLAVLDKDEEITQEMEEQFIKDAEEVLEEFEEALVELKEEE